MAAQEAREFESSVFDDISFSVEIHTNLQVANISLHNIFKKCVVVSVKTHEVICTFHNEVRKFDDQSCNVNLVLTESDPPVGLILRLKTNGNFSFVPATLSGLEGLISSTSTGKEELLYHSEKNLSEICFRIQLFIAGENMTNSCRYVGRHSPDSGTIQQCSGFPLDKNASQSLICVCCRSQMICSLKFSRIVELPSEGWEDLACEWFCHQHGERQTEVLMKDSCVFTDATSFFIREDLLTLSSVVRSGDDQRLRCPRCLAALGEVRQLRAINPNAVYYAFLQHCVVLEPAKNHSHCASSVLEGLVTIIDKQLEPTLASRMCLEYKASTECILLWVMDRNLQRFSACVDFIKTTVRTITIEPHRVIKVLYLASPRKGELCQRWLTDSSVEMHRLEENSFWEVLDALLHSTENCTISHRRVDGFFVGYLPITCR